MANRTPEIKLSEDDRRLLFLLARLITEEGVSGANFRSEAEVVLSDWEAQELVYLLDEFSSSSRFIDGSYFVEALFDNIHANDARTREIYLKWRKRNGRTRALASTHWQEFLVRLGLTRDYAGPLRGSSIIQARRMDIYKFLSLERKLLEHSDLHPRVRALILRLVAAKSNAIEAMRDGKDRLPKGSVAKLPNRLSKEVEESRTSPVGVKPMSTQKVAGIMTIVIDMSALFTTRDWNVVGTLSALGGALVAANE